MPAGMTHLGPGEPGPLFSAPTPTLSSFAFGSVAGRYVLLGFLPEEPVSRSAALRAVERNHELLDDHRAMAFLVSRRAETFHQLRDLRGLRWFKDAGGEVSRLYGVLSPEGQAEACWILLDPSLRIMMVSPIDQAEAVFGVLRALPPPDLHAGVPIHAPVLIAPRVLDPDYCRRLIDHYERVGGLPSGVMREKDGRTIGVLDDFKRRADCLIEDEAMQLELRRSIVRRLAPEIEKAFQFRPTRIERYIVAAYDADGGGYFRPHRDNTTAGTAHRRFAVTINLNAEDYEGGDLRFPEFGQRTYRAPTGGAVVFSCSLLHEATPVTRGRRYATLPFLYDEAGAAIRDRNRHLVEMAPVADPG